MPLPRCSEIRCTLYKSAFSESPRDRVPAAPHRRPIKTLPRATANSPFRTARYGGWHARCVCLLWRRLYTRAEASRRPRRRARRRRHLGLAHRLCRCGRAYASRWSSLQRPYRPPYHTRSTLWLAPPSGHRCTLFLSRTRPSQHHSPLQSHVRRPHRLRRQARLAREGRHRRGKPGPLGTFAPRRSVVPRQAG